MRHLTFIIILNSDCKREVQITRYMLRASNYCPFILSHVFPVVQIGGTVPASHAEKSLLKIQQQNQNKPNKPYDGTLTNIKLHFTFHRQMAMAITVDRWGQRHTRHLHRNKHYEETNPHK